MNIGVEISLYPLHDDYIPPIRGFIERLNTDGRFKVMTNDMSTQVFGRYEEVMDALTRELRPTFERDGKAIFVMKVLGPLGSESLPAAEVLNDLRDPRDAHRGRVRRARGAAQPAVLDRRRRQLGAARRSLAGCASCPCSPALQVFFVGMSVYGWLSWTRSAAAGRIAGGRVAVALASGRRARASRCCRSPPRRCWPRRPSGRVAAARFPDHLVQPAGHLARGARASSKTGSTGSPSMEYWCSSSTCKTCRYLALLNVLFIGIAAGGFVAWRRRLHGAGGARMIAGELLQHVPGCEDGEPPFSQELIGGGKVNRSFLVRTRRGRFVVRLNENSARILASIAIASWRCMPRRRAPASRRR